MASSTTAVGASKPFSLSFGSAKPKTTSAAASRKRPHSALAEPDSDHEEESSGPQLVSAFDQSGAVISNGSAEKKSSLLVIQAEKNKDWREESRKRSRKNLLPAEVQAAQSAQTNGHDAAHVDRDEVSKVSGIQFVGKDREGDTTMVELEAAQVTPAQPAQPPKTVDEEAMEALVGGERKSNFHIPVLAEDDQYDNPTDPSYPEYANEDDRFKADVASRPDVATLDDYSATPVEEFGAALLRGMGWKDGEAVGKRRAGLPAPKKPIIKERRPNLLGIGAKEVPGGVGDEFGAWGKAAKGKRKMDLTYSPVLLKNSVTGELLTEDELAKKKDEEKANKTKGGEDDWRKRRDRNLKIDAERKGDVRENTRLALEGVADAKRYRDQKDSQRRHHTEDGRRRDRSRSRDRRDRDRSRDGKREERDRSRDGGSGRHSSSRRHSRSRERSYQHSSSRRERSRSTERRHRRH